MDKVYIQPLKAFADTVFKLNPNFKFPPLLWGGGEVWPDQIAINKVQGLTLDLLQAYKENEPEKAASYIRDIKDTLVEIRAYGQHRDTASEALDKLETLPDVHLFHERRNK